MAIDDAWLAKAREITERMTQDMQVGDSIDLREYILLAIEGCKMLPEALAEIESLRGQNQKLREALVEERAAVLTCDICDGGGDFGGLSFSGRRATDGVPTRVDDFTHSDERRTMARRQLATELPELGPWEEEEGRCQE